MSESLKIRKNGIGQIIDLEKFRSIQRSICKKIEISDPQDKTMKFVSGVDIAYLKEEAIIGIATFDFQNKRLVDRIIEIEKAKFPYIPGFLAFREGLPIINVIKKMGIDSDIYMINAHGIAHPEGCGCASHVGVLIKKPTIGVASRILCGSCKLKPTKVGEWSPLNHNGKKVGAVLKSKDGCRPIIISVGNMITLEKSISIVKEFLKDGKLPEPLKAAHEIAVNKRRRLATLNEK
ncbi:hypothetical protein AC481_03850 [miscellaneous Crenarchaeota group archaeon SMTZ-80]|nr:MAG: hypothetical protein AC481_03850 [miscellaneous Crenarchaeota group archaeon SMTZ-80]